MRPSGASGSLARLKARAPALLGAFALSLTQVPDIGTFDVSAAKISTPIKICDVDLGQLSGSLRRLSWNPSGTSLYLQTRDDDDRLYDYIVDPVTHDISRAFGEPGWAGEYWMRKSALAAPGVPALKLEITENNRRTRPIPFTGGFANGGAQTPDPKNPVDAYEHEVTVRYLGVEIGNWINGAPMAGDTFGWGPDGTGALVFADGRGRLTLIDRAKHTRAVPGTKDALFPAWSSDGARLAFLQKAGRRKYALMAAAIDR
jgi:hypothetical protein